MINFQQETFYYPNKLLSQNMKYKNKYIKCKVNNAHKT